MQDVKEMVQVCLEGDAGFIKTFGSKFTLTPMGSTTAGFSKGGKDFFTTFGSYQVQSKKRMGVVSLVATHDGLQTLELHLDEDDTRDVHIIDTSKLQKPDSVTVVTTREACNVLPPKATGVVKAPVPKTAGVKPLNLAKLTAIPARPMAKAGLVKNIYNHHQHEESSSLATPATALETACDEDDPFGSVADDAHPASMLLENDLHVGGDQVVDRADDETCDGDDSSMRDARCRLMRLKASQPQQVAVLSEREEPRHIPRELLSRRKSREEGYDIPLEIDTASLEKSQPEMIKSRKPLDDTYNSDDEDGVDDDSSNPFLSSSEDDLSIADDETSSDDDSDKRDVRCQQRRLSVGYCAGAYR